jgi:hypothetical protein
VLLSACRTRVLLSSKIVNLHPGSYDDVIAMKCNRNGSVFLSGNLDFLDHR